MDLSATKYNSPIYLEAVREKLLRAAGSDASLFSSRQIKLQWLFWSNKILICFILSFCLIPHHIKHFRKDSEIFSRLSVSNCFKQTCFAGTSNIMPLQFCLTQRTTSTLCMFLEVTVTKYQWSWAEDKKKGLSLAGSQDLAQFYIDVCIC